MKLNHPGVYRIIGEHFELLATVVGEVPCLRIASALSINDLVQKSKFTALEEESPEIQAVYANPDKFVFLEYNYSDAAKLPPYRVSIRGIKCPDISENQFKEFVERYKIDKSLPGRGIAATKYYIVEKTGWTLSQAHAVILKIVNFLRNAREYDCYN